MGDKSQKDKVKNQKQKAASDAATQNRKEQAQQDKKPTADSG